MRGIPATERAGTSPAKKPTAARRIVATRCVTGSQDGSPVKTFWDELNDVQRTVLGLLGVPTAAYGQQT